MTRSCSCGPCSYRSCRGLARRSGSRGWPRSSPHRRWSHGCHGPSPRWAGARPGPSRRRNHRPSPLAWAWRSRTSPSCSGLRPARRAGWRCFLLRGHSEGPGSPGFGSVEADLVPKSSRLCLGGNPWDLCCRISDKAGAMEHRRQSHAGQGWDQRPPDRSSGGCSEPPPADVT